MLLECTHADGQMLQFGFALPYRSQAAPRPLQVAHLTRVNILHGKLAQHIDH